MLPVARDLLRTGLADPKSRRAANSEFQRETCDTMHE